MNWSARVALAPARPAGAWWLAMIVVVIPSGHAGHEQGEDEARDRAEGGLRVVSEPPPGDERGVRLACPAIIREPVMVSHGPAMTSPAMTSPNPPK